MNPRSTDCNADALTTTPSRRLSYSSCLGLSKVVIVDHFPFSFTIHCILLHQSNHLHIISFCIHKPFSSPLCNFHYTFTAVVFPPQYEPVKPNIIFRNLVFYSFNACCSTYIFISYSIHSCYFHGGSQNFVSAWCRSQAQIYTEKCCVWKIIQRNTNA